MIDATDLTSAEVRFHYLAPLLLEISDRVGLTTATVGGGDANRLRDASSSRASASSQSYTTGGSERGGGIGRKDIAYVAKRTDHRRFDAQEGKGDGVRTLFEEIAATTGASATTGSCSESNANSDSGSSGLEGGWVSSTATASDGDIVGGRERCFAELLEEVSSLVAFMTPSERDVVTAAASARLLSHLVPQCDWIQFLHSYFPSVVADMNNDGDVLEKVPMTLDERLENAVLSKFSAGGVFPYSAPRMAAATARSALASSFLEFVRRGLGSYVSSGRAFRRDDNGAGGASTAGSDMIRILAMSICPNSPPTLFHSSTEGTEVGAARGGVTRKGVTDADVAAGVLPLSTSPALSISQSSVPLIFSLCYADRVELVRLCADRLTLPERDGEEDDADDNDDADLDGAAGGRRRWTSPLHDLAIPELRAALLGFANLVALSESDAVLAHRALANVAIREGRRGAVAGALRGAIQFFQYGGGGEEEVTSEYAARAGGDIAADLIVRHNGSRYYADGVFTGIALRELSNALCNEAARGVAGGKDKGNDDDSSARDRDEKRARLGEWSDSGTSSEQQHTRRLRRRRCEPYRLEGILRAARPLFYFLLEGGGVGDDDASKTSRRGGGGVESRDDDGDAAASQGNERTNMYELIQNATSLLYYPADLKVVQAAAKFVALALAYDGNKKKKMLKHLFCCVRKALFVWRLNAARSRESGGHDRAVVREDIIDALGFLITTASRQSGTFAFNLLSLTIADAKADVYAPSGFDRRLVWKLASLVSLGQPRIVSARLEELRTIHPVGESSSEHDIADLIATHLSCAMASRSAVSGDDEPQEAMAAATRVDPWIRRIANGWTLFRLARHALATGNFRVARRIYAENLLPLSTTNQGYIWLRSLSLIAHAEEVLEEKGIVGVSEASTFLNSCSSAIQSLSAIESDRSDFDGNPFNFQLDLIKQRLDFLHICTVTRAFCMESHMIGAFKSHAGTRSNVHRQNIPKCFYLLATRYQKMHGIYGIYHTQQTKTTLRTLFALCRFMGDFFSRVYCETTSFGGNSRTGKDNEFSDQSFPLGDTHHPMGGLIRRLRCSVLKPSGKSKGNTRVSATDLLNVIDAVFRGPFPFPRGFLKPTALSRCCVTLTADVEKHNEDAEAETESAGDEFASVDVSGVEIVPVVPGTIFKLSLCGVIPPCLIKSASIPFTQIIAWRMIYYEGQVVEDEEDHANQDEDVSNRSERRVIEDNSSEPFLTSMLPDGKFILPMECRPIAEEGYYRVTVELGCRDVRFGEWNIPTQQQKVELFLCVEENT